MVVVSILAVFRPLPALGFAVGGIALIWLRGYLVPYTPRFAPQLVARLPVDVFSHSSPSDNLGDLDPGDGEAVLESLVRAGAVSVDGERLVPTEDFATVWREWMDDFANASDEELVDAATEFVDGVDSARIESVGSETYLVVSGDRTAWIRRPVAVAELGAAAALAETDRIADNRDLAAHALCAFLETCPVCDTELIEGPADDCCGNAVPAPGNDPPDVLACEQCGVAFYRFEPAGTDAHE